MPQITDGYDDKLAHGLMYSGLMAWFAVLAQRAQWQGIAAWAFTLGAVLECCQAILPYRTASVADVFANGFGILFGVVAALLLTTGSQASRRAQ